MKLRVLTFLFLALPVLVRADSDIPPSDESGRQETSSDQEWEAKDIIPSGGLTVSTQPITPITLLPPRNPHDQALQELSIAQDLWSKGKAEAASDVALEAYDDLMSLKLAHRNKKKRKQLRQERHQAATVYTNSSITYIQGYAKKGNGNSAVIEEARERLGDLRDVVMNYPELNKKLNDAQGTLSGFSVKISCPTAKP